MTVPMVLVGGRGGPADGEEDAEGRDKIEGRIRQAGFKAVRRNVRYDWLNEPG